MGGPAVLRPPHAEIAGLFDTVYVSLYEGLQGIRGALLAADRATMDEAAVWRRRLGGAIPDAWPLALAALAGLDTHLPAMAAYRDHAVALAAAIDADGLARTVPDPPQTPLFHVHLPVGPAAVERAAGLLRAERGWTLFGRVRSTEDPHRSAFEITVGAPTLEVTPAELAALVRELVERAR